MSFHLSGCFRKVASFLSPKVTAVVSVRNLSTSTGDFSHVRNVGVIGAGVAGMQMAIALKNGGYNVQVFDKAPDVGGLWRSNYRGFGIQVPKALFEFPDASAPYGNFAAGEEVQQYIKTFAQSSKILPFITFNTEVLSVAPRADGKRGWTFVVQTKGSEKKSVDFDYAVVCTGMYSTVPNLPSYAGTQDFKGQILHSSEYTDHKIVAGKNVVVVGGGKSSLDVVCDASNVAASSTLLYRSAHWGTPQNIAGLIPFKYVFLSRFGQALVSWYKGAWPTAATSVKTAHNMLSGVMGPVFRIVEALFAFQLGHKGDYKPQNDVVKDFYGYAQVLDSTFKDYVASGKVKATRGEIAKLTAQSLQLTNGQTVPCDVLICATGFGKGYSYFPADILKNLDINKDGHYLYRHCIPPSVKDLAFVGSEVATISNIATYAIQAAWLTHLFQGRFALPSPAQMQAEVDEVKAWKRSWMPETVSRANLVLLHQIHYHDSLFKDMKLPHRRKGSNVLAEIFAPYQPKDYAGVLDTVARPAAAR